MPGFAQAVLIVLDAEKGLADVKGDRGGRTNFGITSDVWRLYRDQLGKAGQPVDNCTVEDATFILHQGYWVRGKCDGLPWPLSLVHFDSMVQHGQAPRLLQRTLGVPEDGMIGPGTLAAAASGDPVKLAENLIWNRVDYYRSLPDDQFDDGWMARLSTLRRYVVGQRPIPVAA